MSSFLEGQINQLANSLEEGGFTPELITKLGQFNDKPGLITVLNGTSEIVLIKHIVDLDADPMIPDGWTVEEHIKGGQFEFDPEKVALHLDEEQQDGGRIVGNELRKKLKGRGFYNANLLDFYLVNPQLILEEWKGRYIFFWGTIYRRSDGYLFVRCLRWRGDRWRWSCRWLGDDFFGRNSAVLPAS